MKKNRIKKILLSLALCFALVVSCVPMTALATDASPSTYNVIIDEKLDGIIEISEGSFAVEGQDYNGKLTVSPRYFPSSAFDLLIIVNGEPTRNFSLVSGELYIPADTVTGDVLITCNGELERNDVSLCFEYFAGDLSPVEAVWNDDYSSATMTYSCAFCENQYTVDSTWVTTVFEPAPTCVSSGVFRYMATDGNVYAFKDFVRDIDPNNHLLNEQGICVRCNADTPISVVAGESVHKCGNINDFSEAVVTVLEEGYTDITMNLPEIVDVEFFTVIRRALLDTEGVTDGSINLTIAGVSSIPDVDYWS